MFRTRALLLAVTALLSFAGLPGDVRGQEQRSGAQEAAPNAGPQRIEMTVLGLSCPFCAYGLEKKLKKVEGLTGLNIDFKTAHVWLEVKDGSAVTDERIKELVKEAGFEVEEIKRFPLADSPEAKRGGAA